MASPTDSPSNWTVACSLILSAAFVLGLVFIPRGAPASTPDAGILMHVGDRFTLGKSDADLYRADMSMKTLHRYIFSPNLEEGTTICLDGLPCGQRVERTDAGWVMKAPGEE